jgi:hypothetical protein
MGAVSVAKARSSLPTRRISTGATTPVNRNNRTAIHHRKRVERIQPRIYTGSSKQRRITQRSSTSQNVEQARTLIFRSGSTGVDSETRRHVRRFLSHVRASRKYSYQGTPCWIWTAGKSSTGYGAFKVAGKQWSAPRWIATVAYGDLGKNQPDHLCRRRSCVNLEHLEVVTKKENILRGMGVAAINARKTHCLQGHLLTSTNCKSYELKKGERRCKLCAAQSCKAWRLKREA